MKVLAQNRTRAFDKKAVVKCAAAVALLIAASKVSFAIGPVPLTMQTFAVAVVGAWLGTRQGVAAVVAYLALGFAGLPVFATPLCGPAALMGPTAGYLVSFPMAAAISGLLAERGWTGKRIFASFINQYASNIFIVFFGTIWLSATLGVEKAVMVGIREQPEQFLGIWVGDNRLRVATLEAFDLFDILLVKHRTACI